MPLCSALWQRRNPTISDIVLALYDNLYYAVAMVLFVIGLHTMLTHSNLIKKIMALNIMETAIFLFFISGGYVANGRVPIIEGSRNSTFVNPLPQALILTGIVIAVSLTAFALSLIVRLYQFYGTLDADEIAQIRLGREERP